MHGLKQTLLTIVENPARHVQEQQECLHTRTVQDDLSRTYLAQHELESVTIIIIITRNACTQYS